MSAKVSKAVKAAANDKAKKKVLVAFLVGSDKFRKLATKKASTALEKILAKNDIDRPMYGKGRPNEEKRREQCADALYAGGVSKL